MANNLSATEFKERVCDRFRLAWEVTRLRKGVFAARVGISASQLTNIFRYKNLPPPQAIVAAVKEFGFTTDFFLMGDRAGMRDPTLPEKLRQAAAKLNIVDY